MGYLAVFTCSCGKVIKIKTNEEVDSHNIYWVWDLQAGKMMPKILCRECTDKAVEEVKLNARDRT